jgi:hypothetical protein
VARLLVLVHQSRFGVGGRPGGARRGAGGGTWNWNGQAPNAAPGGFAPAPWWTAATVSGAAAVGAQGGTVGEVDRAAAARLYGDGPEAASVAEADANVDDGEAWLDGAALGPADVDEEALAAAMADDELGGMTPEELAQLEAGLMLGEDSEDSTDADGEEIDQ